MPPVESIGKYGFKELVDRSADAWVRTVWLRRAAVRAVLRHADYRRGGLLLSDGLASSRRRSLVRLMRAAMTCISFSL